MVAITQEIANFVDKTQFTDLPDYVTGEMKRVILDSIGCALAGHSTHKGKISAGLARSLGGPYESTIIGTNDKASCTNAAFANGELMNSLDFDAIAGLGRHDVPALVSATLGLAEKVGASGKSLILATALAFEISGRLKTTVLGTHDPDPQKDKMAWPPVNGYNTASIGAAVGAGKLLNLNPEQVANAVSIAGYICPVNPMRKWMERSPVSMAKYIPLGWVAHAGVAAALLADMGYTGDTDLFDGEFGFWRYNGKNIGEWNMEKLREGLGTKWRCHEINYKQYPCGFHMGGVLDKFIEIIEENNLRPEDIERVKAQPHPLSQFKFVRENTLETPDDYCFNVGYLLACAAHRINPARWHDPDVKQDRKIQEYMRTLDLDVIINEKDFATAKRQDPRTYQQKIEVTAKGKTFKETAAHPKGGWYSKELRNTDEELVKKFTDNASRILPLEKGGKAAQTIFELEKLENTAELLVMVAP